MDALMKLSREAQGMLVGTALFIILSFFGWQAASIDLGSFGTHSVSFSLWHSFYGVIIALIAILLFAWELIRALDVKIEFLSGVEPGVISTGLAVALGVADDHPLPRLEPDQGLAGVRRDAARDRDRGARSPPRQEGRRRDAGDAVRDLGRWRRRGRRVCRRRSSALRAPPAPAAVVDPAPAPAADPTPADPARGRARRGLTLASRP